MGGAAAVPLLSHQHCLRFTLQVDVRLAAHVDGDPLDRAPSEAVGPLAGIVKGHWIADITTDSQTLARDHVAARLGLDAALADFPVAVEERKDTGRHRGRIDTVLLERGR